MVNAIKVRDVATRSFRFEGKVTAAEAVELMRETGRVFALSLVSVDLAEGVAVVEFVPAGEVIWIVDQAEDVLRRQLRELAAENATLRRQIASTSSN